MFSRVLSSRTCGAQLCSSFRYAPLGVSRRPWTNALRKQVNSSSGPIAGRSWQRAFGYHVPKRIQIPVGAGRLPGSSNAAPRSQYLANTMYKEGRTLLYEAPKSLSYSVNAHILGIACIGSTLWLLSSQFWKAPDLPWIVPLSYRLSMFVMTGLGFWMIYRTWGQVKRIELISQMSRARIQTTIRKRVPFMKPQQIVSDVDEFVLPRSMESFDSEIGPIEAISTEGMTITQRISYFIWRNVLAVRRLFTNELFIVTKIKSIQGYKIDYTGDFPQGLDKLVALVQQDRY